MCITALTSKRASDSSIVLSLQGEGGGLWPLITIVYTKGCMWRLLNGIQYRMHVKTTQWYTAQDACEDYSMVYSAGCMWTQHNGIQHRIIVKGKSEHYLKESEWLLHRPVSPGRRGRVVAFDFLIPLVADVGMATLDHLHRKVVQLLEVIWAVCDLVWLITCTEKEDVLFWLCMAYTGCLPKYAHLA